MLLLMYSVARVLVDGAGSARCAVPVEVPLSKGERCVHELEHVHELGTVVELLTQEAPPTTSEGMGRVLRVATPEDLERERTNREVAAKAMEAFRKYATESQVPARPRKAHFSLRRERLALWYTSDEPVDVRQILGHLQRQFATRVDAQASGVRDEAALVGGCGVCGRSLCCATWLREFPSVHIGMARQQEVSLIPGAVNGMCGCLKCCLRYENDQYVESGAGMPPTGYLVSWADGEGVVVARDILARKVTVKSDGRFLTLPVSDLHRSQHSKPRAANDANDPGLEEKGAVRDEDSDA